MKKYGIIALTFVLTALVLTGCRGRRNDMNGVSEPTTILPTVELPTVATTEATTVPTTMPTTHPTEHTGETATETAGHDGIVDTNPTEGDNAHSRSRRIPGSR